MNEVGYINDLVSIISPTYNCGEFIAETIESVLAQTYSNWEMIIVDDCSMDNTRTVVESFNDPRVKYHCLKKNSGAAVARNTALKMAKGRWIAFLDCDDLWEPVKLEHQLRFMRENEYVFTCTNRDEIDENSNPTGRYSTGPERITRLGMYCYCWPGCLTVMYDASVVGVIQIADLKKNNDYAIWLKVIRFADCYKLNENLAHWRQRKGSISNTGYFKLIKWHYRLFREAEQMSIMRASFWTLCNLFFGVAKKILYVKKTRRIND